MVTIDKNSSSENLIKSIQEIKKVRTRDDPNVTGDGGSSGRSDSNDKISS